MGKATDILNRRKKYGSTYVNAEYDIAKNSTAALDILNNRRIDKLKKELNSVDIKSLYEYKDFGLSEDKKKEYKTTLSNYKSALESLKKYDLSFSDDKYNKILQDIDLLSNKFDVLSNYKTESEYNDAVKLGELYNMSSADIEKQMGISNEEYESKLAPLEAEYDRLNNKIRLYNRGDRSKFSSSDAYNKARKRRDELKKQISNQKNKNDIAYTTSSGQNITWSSIYKKKKDEEDFNALYNEMSAMPDWAEQSQYKPTFDTSKGETVFDADDFEYERANVPNTSVNGFKDTRYVLQTNEKEKELFNYLAHTKGTDYALDWLMSREDVYKERLRTKNIENAQKFAKEVPVISDAVAVMSSLVTPFEYLGNVVTGNIGERTMSADVASAIKGTRMEQIDWEVGEWDVFDFLYGTATSMAESALAMGTFGGLGGVSLGLNAAAQGTNDALDRGMSKGQAFVSGAASGIFEGLFESWSIGAFGDLSKNLKRADFRNLAKFVGKNMWNNAKEEFLTEVANIAYDAFVNGDFSQYETSIRQYMASGMSEAEAKTQVAKELGVQVAEAAGSGALMGFGFGVAEGGKVRHNIKQMGKQIKDAGETRNLVDLGKSLGEGTESYELANKITDKSKAFAIGQLYGIEAEDIANANKSDIVNTFIEKGFNPTEAKSIVNKMFEEGVDSVSNIRGMVTPTQVYNDVINNPNSTVSQREEAYRGILQGIAENQNQKAKSKKSKNTQADSKPATTSQGMLPLASNYVGKRTEQLVASGIPIEQATQIAQGEFAENQSKMPTRIEKAVESKFESNTEGKDFNSANDKVIASKKLVSSDKDNMKFEVTYEDGTTEEVDANNIDFGNDGEALVYSTVMDMNVPVGIAETLIGGYKGNDIKSAATYVNGMREAFTFGKYNQEADLNNGQYASQLTDEQRNNAFKLGKIYANEKAIADTVAIVGDSKSTAIKKREGKVHFEGDNLSLKSVQDVSLKSIGVLSMALGKDIHIFESYEDANGNRVYKDANGNIKKAPNGFYDQKDGSIWIDLNAGENAEGTMMYTVAHELTHFIKQWSPTKFKALADFLVEQYGKEGVSVDALVRKQQAKAKRHGRDISYDVAFEEMVADSMETMLTDGKVIRELAKKDKGLFDKIKSWIDNLLRRLNKEYKNYSPESVEGQTLRKMKKTFEEAQRLFADALVDASDNFAIKGTDKAFVENYLKTKDVVYNLRAAESHQDKLSENYTSDASIDLETLQKRYAKVIDIWEKLGGELNSKFLNEWNNKVGKDRAFTIFKAQAGYKYNVELSSMCKKGVPLFEAIDTIVKKEVMNELKTKTIGKAEKEILYDILKNHNFEIPCAICYVEQARQREGVIINDFLDGKIEKNAKGNITKYKLGWNDVLNRVEKEMKKNGVDYTFRNVDKSIATDSYAPADNVMDEATQDAFYKALKKVANAEIVRWNREDRKSNQKERRQITDLKPQTIKEVFKGTLPSNLKIFKVLFNNPSSRFKMSRDLLYSSATTLNLANSHNDLYSLFNSQGGVSGYKTKQAPIVYWGDILGKSWKPSTVRKEGGIRNQSNSDFQMYTLLDQAQMYIDFSAKGYYLQAYTKVLAELKLFGLSRGKINASLIPRVIEYKNADGSINWAKTMENAGLDENGNPIYDDFEGINHTEAFMLIEDAEYSKNICGICIGYSDNHIRKLLDDNRVQQIIGFHDKTDNPEKRYRGAKYSKNYNGLNEAVKVKADGTEETVHVGFNQFVSKAEKMFKFNKKTETFEGTVNHNGKEYSANDIPRLAADLYLEMCAEKNYRPAYNDFSSHKNYYKLLADFGLYDSQGNYAPHQKVQYNMPDQVPYLDKNGNKAYMSTEAYIKAELQKELTVRDSISEALADTSENGIIPQFVERVNALHSEADTTLLSDRDSKGNKLSKGQIEYFKDSKIRDSKGRLIPVYHGSKNAGFTKFAKSDDIGYFFARSIKTAQTYSGTKKIYAPNKNSAEFSGAANYNTYLNIKNPYIIDGNGLYWNNLESYGYDPVTVEIKSSHWNEDGSGKATLSLEYKGKTYKQTVHNSTEFENFLANHLNHEIAIAFAHAVDAKFDEKGKGHFATQIPWDFSSSKRGKSKNTRDIVRRAEGWNYDGVIFRNVIDSGDGSKIKADDLYVAFYPNQIKSVNNTEPTSNPDIRYSERDYSYESLVSKPDMSITLVNDKVTYKPTSTIRKNIVDKAIKNASSFGKLNENGNVVIHVDDIDTDVILSKNSLIHGLDRRLEISAPVILNVGSILKNSIRINELTPKKQSAIGSYVLIGYAESTDYAYPVRMVVNQYTNEVDTIDVLYAVNTKKETVGKMPGSHGKAALPTVSNIRIADLLEFVNKHFSDVLPESVLKHYGHTERPKGELGESALFSERDTNRDYAPTFYSQMGKVVEGVKQEKLAANSVVNLLRGKGVKAEEIRWSGIVPFLEGKKSVTKQELLDFINGSMLQIEEVTRSNKEIPYNEYQLSRISAYERERDGIVDELKTEWKRVFGKDIPMQHFGAGLESAVVSAIHEAERDIKNTQEVGKALASAREELKKIFDNDDFGYDSSRQAYKDAIRDPEDFMYNFDLSTEEIEVFERFMRAKTDYRSAEGVSLADKRALKDIATRADSISNMISRVKNEHYTEASRYMTKWRRYSLDGGENYREIVFTLPNSSYSNEMMQVHWDEEAKGVLVHARIQDFNVNGKKMLFVEEIQSDWHNEGHKEGYREDAKAKEIQELEAKAHESFLAVEDYSTELTGLAGEYEAVAKTQKGRELLRAKFKAEKDLKQAQAQFDSKVPDAPFKENYHEYVLKRLLRMAAEQGYDSIGWTTAQTQDERWNDHQAHEDGKGVSGNLVGYTIEYDQDMPKFLKKYGRQWGAKVEKTKVGAFEQQIDVDTQTSPNDDAWLLADGISFEGTEIWAMDITDSMKNSVLYEGQTLYSERDTDSVSTRSLLANALEGTAQNDIEKNKLAQYKEKIALIEAEQKKLHELREKMFTKGINGDERRKIQDEATRTANRINTYDRQLFNLEATTALKNVLTREKELARKRQKQKDAENLREYKEKVAKTTRELLEKNRESRHKAIESRNKTEVRHKIKKVVNDLNNLLLKPSKERHVPEEMRVAVAEALTIVNMDTVDAETRVARLNEKIAKANDPDIIASLTESRDRILEQGNKLGEKLKNLKEAYGMVRDSADNSLNSMYDDVIYNKIETVQKKVGKTPLRNMTLEQLESVYELYKMVLTTVRDSNKAFAENITMTRQALGSNTFEEIKENNKAKDRIRFEGVKKFGWKYLKPMLAMKTIGSETLQKLWNNILYGQEVFAQDYDEAVKFAKETKEKYGYDKWDLLKQYSFESKSGKVMKINLEQMMSIYAYSKRKQADEHIEFGGILLNESIIKEKNKLGKIVEVKVNDSTAYRLDKMQVGEIIATLEKEFPGAKDFVDEMQKYLSETMGEKGNEVSMKMYGIKLFKEEHYFPLKSSKEFMEAANAKLKGDVKIKNKGMTKSTVEHASNPIVLENFLDVWGNHINEMAMYHGLVLPLEDFSRTLNYSFKADEKLNTDAESVRTALHDAFGDSADNYLNELLKAINGGVLHDSSAEFADKMISNFKKAKVMASLSVIVQQPTAIIRAMGIINPKYFVAQNFHHKATWEELKKYCPTAIIKETGSFDTNMGRTIVDMIKEDRKLTEKVGDALGKAPAYMDEMGWNMIWRALKKKVATEQNLSGEELLKECGKQMTLIINETQVYDSVMSRNELMRSKHALIKMATAFMGEPTTVANMIYGASLDVKRGKKGYASKTVAAVISSVVVNGLVSSLVYAFRDDDEEKTWLEKYLASATTELIDGLNSLTYIPFVKDAYSLFQGYDVERTDMALIGDVVDAIDDFYNVLDPEAYEDMSRGEIAKHIYENAKPLLTSICDMFGLPVGNILRDAEAIIINDNLPMAKTSSEGSGLAVKEGWLNASPKLVEKFVDDEKYHKLYLIANNGDTAYVKNEVSEMIAEKAETIEDETDSYKIEKKAKQSVKSSFTGVYRDVYKKAYKNKDSKEMNEIRKFLYATGLWDSLRELDNLLEKWREDVSEKKAD